MFFVMMFMSMRMLMRMGMESELLVMIRFVVMLLMVSGSENRIVNGWIIFLNSRISIISMRSRLSSMVLLKFLIILF